MCTRTHTHTHVDPCFCDASCAVYPPVLCAPCAVCPPRGVGKEVACIAGHCLLAVSHYHEALSPGLTLQPELGTFTSAGGAAAAVSSGGSQGAPPPLWSEPFWTVLSVQTYQKEDTGVGWVMCIGGLTLLVVTYCAVFVFKRQVNKIQKVL
jgi:hypothetical protein